MPANMATSAKDRTFAGALVLLSIGTVLAAVAAFSYMEFASQDDRLSSLAEQEQAAGGLAPELAELRRRDVDRERAEVVAEQSTARNRMLLAGSVSILCLVSAVGLLAWRAKKRSG